MDTGDRVSLLLGIANVGLGIHRLVVGSPAGAISLVIGLLLLWTVRSGPRGRRRRARGLPGGWPASLMTRRKAP